MYRDRYILSNLAVYILCSSMPYVCSLNIPVQLFPFNCRADPILKTFNDLYLAQIVNEASNISIVSRQRLRLTATLTYASLFHQGDVVETGVFTGGSSFVMLKIILDFDKCKKLWAFDSFQGLPDPVQEDKIGNRKVGRKGEFTAEYELFKENLMKNNVWVNQRIQVVPGWFSDTVSNAKIQNISFLRLDGDLYKSTKDVLTALYPKVVYGGFVYIDDYYVFNGCKSAVDEYRSQYGIQNPLQRVTESAGNVEAVWWVK